MKAPGFIMEQIPFALRQAETGTKIHGIRRTTDLCEAMSHNRKKQAGGEA